MIPCPSSDAFAHAAQQGFDAGPAPTALRPQTLDLVFIEGLQVETVIGIHESELHHPQPLVIDLHAGLPRAVACDSDHIADTIDYSKVRVRLHRLVTEHRLQLLEAFAEAVAEILITEFRAHWVRVKVVKPRKFDDLQSVGVQIERWAPQDGPGLAAPTPTSPATSPATSPTTSPATSPASGPQRAAAVLQLIGRGMVPGSRA